MTTDKNTESKNVSSIDKKIDFHGKILSQAEDKFQKTVIESYKQKKRCLLFITGKGLHKKQNFFDKLNDHKNIIRLRIIYFFSKINQLLGL